MHSVKIAKILGAGLTAAALAFGAAAPALAEAAASGIVSQATLDATMATDSISIKHPVYDVNTNTDQQLLRLKFSSSVAIKDLNFTAVYVAPDGTKLYAEVWYDPEGASWISGELTEDGEIIAALTTKQFYNEGTYKLESITLNDKDHNSITITEGLEAGNYTVGTASNTGTETGTETKTDTSASIDVYRAYNPNSGEHFYTKSAGEIKALVAAGWTNEGYAFSSVDKSAENAAPVYRVYNPNGGDHHYTLSAGERNLLVAAGWMDEGVAFHSLGTTALEGNTPVYRAYNPNAKTGSHHYTTSSGEISMLVKVGWKDEGTGWYAKIDLS